MANRPPKPPMSPMTSGRNVERTWLVMRRTADSPAPMSTPAPEYVRPGRFGFGSGFGAGSSATGVGDLEDLLGERDRHFERVLAGEAGGAVPGTRRLDGGDQGVEREVGEAVAVEVALDLTDRHAGRDELGLRSEVHAVEARP